MTLSSRNRIYRAVAFFSAAFSLALAAFAVKTAAEGGFREFLSSAKSARLFFLRPCSEAALASVFLLVLCSALASAAILRKFEKTLAPETKYFVFFLACLSLESARAALCFFPLRSRFLWQFSLLLRILIFARIFSAVSVFFAAFFSFSDKPQNTNSNLFFGSAASAAFASILPINSPKILDSLSVSIGFFSIAALICAILFAFAVVKVALNGRAAGAPHCRRLAAFFAAMVAGYCILLFSSCVASVCAGFVLFCAGMRFFWSLLYRFYLWE